MMLELLGFCFETSPVALEKIKKIMFIKKKMELFLSVTTLVDRSARWEFEILLKEYIYKARGN